MGGRISVESVAGCAWNGWPNGRGIRTQFRRWATEHLKSYLERGCLLDDDRFKGGHDGGYFEELLARIRDIRSSEKTRAG